MLHAHPHNRCSHTVHFCGRISSLAVASTEKIASIALVCVFGEPVDMCCNIAQGRRRPSVRWLRAPSSCMLPRSAAFEAGDVAAFRRAAKDFCPTAFFGALSET